MNNNLEQAQEKMSKAIDIMESIYDNIDNQYQQQLLNECLKYMIEAENLHANNNLELRNEITYKKLSGILSSY